ncbi:MULTISPECIES: type VI secretion system lipoprotein TssJ [unclassified Modicisalibacter]|uniref:type VI secretion system lipoprotein TssJ n=1 Tax=unclassified Modicisalibacter TaxID=2679913 RepID=UPI001CC9575F|nr:MULTISPECIES: type VI secretion system lipoprotein TssJ [unclassified Modicisalibacter]MBZ9556816.1 type VI secretion system lipoprotein TssJ [Modicisalibacter sp. R2A 31.J]MBZ9574714.1 type VI secretion system lipoprotein TssJ [Modicisalibacter sp. MOD 31.J]
MASLAQKLGFIFLALMLSGCGVADRVGSRFDDTWAGDLFANPERVQVAVEAGDSVNPDVDGDPLSVVVRIYQLTERPPFATASPRQLWRDDEAALGDSLLSRRELTVLPGERAVDTAALAPRAQFVGVAAFFRNTVSGAWHVLFDAEALREGGWLGASDGVRLRLVGDRIEVERGENLLSE